jgi:hypothetical protein
MIFSPFKNSIARNQVNIPGCSTSRKIVVFESDDWGSIRISDLSILPK